MIKWKVSSNYTPGTDKTFYQVYYVIDKTAVDCTGNRHFYPTTFKSKEEAQEKAKELNIIEYISRKFCSICPSSLASKTKNCIDKPVCSNVETIATEMYETLKEEFKND